MNPIQTIRMGILACRRVRAGRCTQSANGYGRGRHPTAVAHSRPRRCPTRIHRGDTRPAPGTLMPQGAAGGEAADGPSTGANGAQGDRPLPGTPPLMQY